VFVMRPVEVNDARARRMRCDRGFDKLLPGRRYRRERWVGRPGVTQRGKNN
jgi:hypothetical protein